MLKKRRFENILTYLRHRITNAGQRIAERQEACNMNKIALVLICSGTDYWRFLQPAIDGAKKYWPAADILLFTDYPQRLDVARQVKIAHLGWPDVTLLRYHFFLSQEEWLSQYTHCFYLDVDMKIQKPIGDEILADGLTMTPHPSFLYRRGTPETNPRSTAYVPTERVWQYCTGAFQGGSTPAFLALCRDCVRNIDLDRRNGFTARWHDESYLQHALWGEVGMRPAKILRVGYYSNQPADSEAHIVLIRKGTPDRPAVDGVQPRGKALIAVVSCDKPEYVERRNDQLATWIPSAKQAGFDVEIFTGSTLDVLDGYLALPIKTQAVCAWALRLGYRRLLKVDDDTFVNVARLTVPEADYAGVVWGPTDRGHHGIPDAPAGTYPRQYCAGGGYWLSERAMRIVADPLSGPWLPHDFVEDRWVGHALAEYQIKPTQLPGYGFGVIDDFVVISQIEPGTMHRLMLQCERLSVPASDAVQFSPTAHPARSRSGTAKPLARWLP